MRSPRDLRDDNPADVAIRAKLLRFLLDPSKLIWFRDVERELAALNLTRADVLDALVAFIDAGRPITTGFFDNNDCGFEITDCSVGEYAFFAHMKFVTYGVLERLKIMSTHPRRWGY